MLVTDHDMPLFGLGGAEVHQGEVGLDRLIECRGGDELIGKQHVALMGK